MPLVTCVEVAVPPLAMERIPVSKFVPIEVVAMSCPDELPARSEFAGTLIKLEPMVVVATIFPFWSVERSALEMPESQTEPKVAREVEAFWKFTTLVKVVEALKRLLPLKVLLLARRVVDAELEPRQVPLIETQPLVMFRPL